LPAGPAESLTIIPHFSGHCKTLAKFIFVDFIQHFTKLPSHFLDAGKGPGLQHFIEYSIFPPIAMVISVNFPAVPGEAPLFIPKNVYFRREVGKTGAIRC
jgi:hypothetical protein